MSASDITLVFRYFEDTEPLGLGYLQSAVRDAGFKAERVGIDRAVDLWQSAESLVNNPPAMVGLSLLDGASAMILLAFGNLLRQRGYGQPIIAGGPFATLARDWLLKRYPWLDAIVRFAGEVPLVSILRARALGDDWTGAAGVTTRQGDGVAAPMLDEQGLSFAPLHSEFSTIFGYKVAHVQATRGCSRRCGYCGPAALQTGEYAEGLAAGISPKELILRGVGGVRRRTVEHLADELAELYHQAGIRYVYFVDEHVLPYEEAGALSYLDGLQAALSVRHVGRLGMGCMLRPDRLTKRVIQRFAEIGLVRAFIGLELATPEEGRRFGRPINVTHALEILDACQKQRVAVTANLMLLHPWATAASIEQGIALIERIQSGTVEPTRMVPYHGTRLQLQLLREGRLLGNPFRYDYRIEDPAAGRFAAAYARLRLDVLGNHSLVMRSHELAQGVALANWLEPDSSLEMHWGALQVCEADIRSLYVRALRHLLKWAKQGNEHTHASINAELIAGLDSLGTEVHTLRARLEGIERHVANALRSETVAFSPIKSAASRAMVFAMSSVALAACGGRADAPDAPIGPQGGTNSPSAASSNQGDDHVAASGGFGQGGSPGSSPIVLAAGGYYESSAIPIADGVTVTPRQCSPELAVATGQEIAAKTSAVDPCFSGSVYTISSSSSEWVVSTAGPVCNPATEITAAAAAVPVPQCGMTVNIDWGAAAQAETATAAVSHQCAISCLPTEFSVSLNSAGFVTDVSTTNAIVSECMRQALVGLSFECLANRSVCSYCFIE